MNLYATTIHAQVSGGRVLEFEGPLVPGDSVDDATAFCEENGLGFCTIRGKLSRELPSHGPADRSAPDFDAFMVVMKPEEALAVMQSLRVMEKNARSLPGSSALKGWFLPVAHAITERIARIATLQNWMAADVAQELLNMIYKPDDIRADRDYRSCTTMTTVEYAGKTYPTIFAALASVRIPGSTWADRMGDADLKGVLPHVKYSGTFDEWKERHLRCLEVCTEQKFAMEPYRSLLLNDSGTAYIEIEGGLTWTDDTGEIKEEFLDMTPILTRIKEGYADEAQ